MSPKKTFAEIEREEETPAPDVALTPARKAALEAERQELLARRRDDRPPVRQVPEPVERGGATPAMSIEAAKALDTLAAVSPLHPLVLKNRAVDPERARQYFAERTARRAARSPEYQAVVERIDRLRHDLSDLRDSERGLVALMSNASKNGELSLTVAKDIGDQAGELAARRDTLMAELDAARAEQQRLAAIGAGAAVTAAAEIPKPEAARNLTLESRIATIQKEFADDCTALMQPARDELAALGRFLEKHGAFLDKASGIVPETLPSGFQTLPEVAAAMLRNATRQRTQGQRAFEDMLSKVQRGIPSEILFEQRRGSGGVATSHLVLDDGHLVPRNRKGRVLPTSVVQWVASWSDSVPILEALLGIGRSVAQSFESLQSKLYEATTDDASPRAVVTEEDAKIAERMQELKLRPATTAVDVDAIVTLPGEDQAEEEV